MSYDQRVRDVAEDLLVRFPRACLAVGPVENAREGARLLAEAAVAAEDRGARADVRAALKAWVCVHGPVDIAAGRSAEGPS